MRIAVVGVCASGKTTLVKGLKDAGYDAYNVAQEHSGIHNFWNKHHPDILVMIDATLPAIKKRRLVYWDQERLDVQHNRLADAKAHANLFIQTDAYNADEVREQVIDYIETWKKNQTEGNGNS
jgi:deoxyadenosine/deoxycytidine kinase